MKSEITDDFRRLFSRLPVRIQRQARKAYQLWLNDPGHPSLEFKRVGQRSPAYSVRIAIGWRVLGVRDDDTLIWFWVGSHADYDELLRRL